MADLHPVAHAVATSRSRRPSIAPALLDRLVDHGEVVLGGTPADLVATGDSRTARHLRAYLERA
jgi:hypothetical protein